MDAYIIPIYLLFSIFYFLFVISLIRQALKLDKKEKGKIIASLIVASVIINILGIIFKILDITLIGFLIFLAGFVQLLYEKFKEGKENEK